MSKIYTAQLLQANRGIVPQAYGYCQQILFTWIYPLLKIGKSVSLNQEHLENIKANTWNKYSQFFTYFLENHYSQGQLLKSLFLAFKYQIGVCFIFYVISVLLFLGQPFITEKSQKFFIYDTEDQRPSLSSMFLFAVVQLLYMLMLSLIKPFQYFQQSILSVKIQGALQQQIITKTLNFPIARSKHFSAGELINMLQVDITQASNYFAFCYQLIMFPIFLITTGLVFYMTLGKEALIPAIGFVVQTIMGLLFGYYYGQIQNNYMVKKDKRMKSVDEALIFTKQVKLNCLEEFFENRIDQTRNDELQYLRYQVYMLIFITFMQGFVSVATYEIWFLFAEKLNFGTLTIMMQNYANIAMLLSQLPNQLKNYSISQNSVKRMENYFSKENINPLEIELDINNSNAIEFEKAVYSWRSIDELHQDPYEIQIDAQIKKGQFIAIVGNSASGKSTILRSILGETYCKSGRIRIHGTVSVAMQEPWIISGSIKKNITFMSQYDQRKYDKIIEICGLARDLRSFKHGDETILGEKGDNLSGGQQKRINLARAIYNDADIYLLDDPLSALDIKVKYQIHKSCLKEYLKGKTRILFTSSLANLQECDQIFIIEDGKISKQGTFAELQNIQIEEYKEFIDTQFEQQYYPVEGSEKQDFKASLIQTEDQQKGNISSNILKQIFRYLGGCWSIVVTLIYFFVILGCYFAGNGIMAKEDLSDEDFRQIAIVAYLLIQFPSTIVIVMLQFFFLFRGLMTSKTLHKKIMNSLLNASFTKFYNTILIGRLMNRLSKDVYNIDLLFPNEVFNLTSVLTQVLFPLVACYLYLNLIAMPLVILFFALLIYLTIIYNRCLREVTRIESVSKSPVFTFFQQVLRGVSYIRTCLKLDKVIQKQQEYVNIDISNQICLNGFQYWYQSITGSITSTFQSILFVVCFLFPGQTQRMTNMVLSQMQTVSTMLLSVAVSYGNIQIYGVSFERCLHLVNNIEREQRNESFITPSDSPNSDDQVSILFDKCSFQYRPNSKCVLQNLSFIIQKGEKIGIVGRTGAGKSSIILALTQMMEQIDGSIKIGGKNMNEYTISQLRSLYSIIPQEPLVFMGTLEENLNPFKKHTKEEINEACIQCKLFQLQSFKQLQLQSEIAVQGSNLSQGEKQLLNITRCLLEKKQIVLIDEATASIDGETEELIKEIFEKCFINYTMLTIAHKVTTIMNSDKIMVIDDGNIVEFDTPENLLKNEKGEFRQIIQLIKQSELL